MAIGPGHLPRNVVSGYSADAIGRNRRARGRRRGGGGGIEGSGRKRRRGGGGWRRRRRRRGGGERGRSWGKGVGGNGRRGDTSPWGCRGWVYVLRRGPPPVSSVVRSAVQLIGWLVGWLANVLVGWSTGWSFSILVDAAISRRCH